MLTIEIPEDQAALIERAAELRRESLESFVLESALMGAVQALNLEAWREQNAVS